MDSKQAEQFLRDYIAFVGEVTSLHGRLEVSKNGYEKMRTLLRTAMEALRSPMGKRNELADPVAKKPGSPASESLWFGYSRSDVKRAIMAPGNWHVGTRYVDFDDSDIPQAYRGQNTGFTVKDIPYIINTCREKGLRRPDEPDYRPLA